MNLSIKKTGGLLPSVTGDDKIIMRMHHPRMGGRSGAGNTGPVFFMLVVFVI